LWLMDLSPLILGVLGRAVGRRQDDAVLMNHELERRIHQVSDANKALADEIGVKAELEEQLRHSQKLEAVGRLAGGVAHDFNNLLTVILGHTEVALDEVDPTQPLHASLQEIRKAAERSADLTRQLLAFARKQTIAPKVLDPNGTIEGMLKMLRRLIGEDMDLAWLPEARI
ncbi:MAG: hypothetical protein KAU31_10015, partial [Spirochaetaceae bacterium]|nr:hypothetical protein [Spirochaetaceae bacterium]